MSRAYMLVIELWCCHGSRGRDRLCHTSILANVGIICAGQPRFIRTRKTKVKVLNTRERGCPVTFY